MSKFTEGWAAYQRSKAHYFRAKDIFSLARSECGRVFLAGALFWPSEAEKCKSCQRMMGHATAS